MTDLAKEKSKEKTGKSPVKKTPAKVKKSKPEPVIAANGMAWERIEGAITVLDEIRDIVKGAGASLDKTASELLGEVAKILQQHDEVQNRGIEELKHLVTGARATLHTLTNLVGELIESDSA